MGRVRARPPHHQPAARGPGHLRGRIDRGVDASRRARVGANLRYYRWRKWLERVRSDDYRDIWEPTARWIASLYDDQARRPVVRVELVRRFHDNVRRGRATAVQGVRLLHLDLDDAR